MNPTLKIEKEQGRTIITRQIESVGKAIDMAVYALYNLKEGEIKVVEGGKETHTRGYFSALFNDLSSLNPAFRLYFVCF
jgi:hypothetical protein